MLCPFIVLSHRRGVNILSLSTVYRFRWHIAVAILLVALLMGMLPLMSHATRATGSHTQSKPVSITFKSHHFSFAQSSLQAPPDSFCRSHFNIPCYSPQEMRNAYDITPVLNAGFNGKGQTIVIIDSFGSPTIVNDLHVFDAGYGLPDPPSFKILTPLGTIKFNPSNPDMVNWAFETSLDVEWAHAIAPGANIVLMTSPVSETQGVQGMPEFLYLEKYAVNHHIGNIISQSWGTTEETLFTPGGRQILNSFNDFYKQAGQQGITFLASSGDSGVANVNVNGKIYPFPTVIFPASSPYVTAVGGTSLYATTSGVYQHETVWNNSIGATWGGVSNYFAEPGYQQQNLPSSDQSLLKGNRGLPDIAYNADPNTAILVYISFLGGSNNGYYFIGGTSEGAPQWAGIIADGNQWAGHPFGFLNNDIYQLGSGSDYGESFHDITVGNNSFAGIKGYNATPGWDLTTGWGTPKAATMLSELIEIASGQSS